MKKDEVKEILDAGNLGNSPKAICDYEFNDFEVSLYRTNMLIYYGSTCVLDADYDDIEDININENVVMIKFKNGMTYLVPQKAWLDMDWEDENPVKEAYDRLVKTDLLLTLYAGEETRKAKDYINSAICELRRLMGEDE